MKEQSNKHFIKNRNKNRNKNENKNENKNIDKKRITIAAVAAVCLLLIIGGVVIKTVYDRNSQAQEAARIAEDIQAKKESARQRNEEEQKEKEKNLLDLFMESGSNVFEAIKKRPPTIVLTEENTDEFVKIDSCKIEEKTKKVAVYVSAEGLPVSDDKYYYLFSLKSYSDEIMQDMDYVAKEYKDSETVLKTSKSFINKTGAILNKFVVAVKKDGRFVTVSKPHYITNPEAIAKYKSGRKTPSTKKGLLIDPNKLRSTELDDLGVKHAAYNIPVSRILGQSTNAVYPTVSYSYNGKNYSFNGQVMSEYDLVFSILTSKGIEVTAIILNDISSAYPQLIHPLARSGLGSAPYYAFNGTDEAGTEYLAAVGAFLAERYSGTSSGKGLVVNWVIGNEINARKEWNHIEYLGLNDYVKEYAKAYRIFYNAIKSKNASCNIYISLDQQWNRDISNSKNYDARDILDEFNSQMKEEGNIDWGVAIHPYNVPLTSVPVWAASKYVKNSADTSMLTMDNIEVLTDYLQQKEFLQEDGEVRSVTLSELGYTSLKGGEQQAAAIVYAYKKAAANEHIDAILFSRETDAPEEVLQGLAFGLNNADGSHKYVWNIYRYMDTDKQKEYTDFAKNIIGISDWSQIMD